MIHWTRLLERLRSDDRHIERSIAERRPRAEIAEFVREFGLWHSIFLHHVSRGDAQRDCGEWHDAYQEYRKALDILPFHSGYLVQAGHMLKELGLTVAAEGYYRSAALLGSPVGEV